MEGTVTIEDGKVIIVPKLGIKMEHSERIKLVVAGFGWYGHSRRWIADETEEAVTCAKELCHESEGNEGA